MKVSGDSANANVKTAKEILETRAKADRGGKLFPGQIFSKDETCSHNHRIT